MEQGRDGQKKDPVLVIIQLSGGNDFMNTVIPYTNGIYHDVRPLVGIPEDRVLPINDELGFHPLGRPPGRHVQGRECRHRSRNRIREL